MNDNSRDSTINNDKNHMVNNIQNNSMDKIKNYDLIGKFKWIEIAGLFILAFFLPIFDAPKHIGYGLLIFGAAGWRILDKKIKLRKPSFLETIIIIILATALISTIINWPLHYGIKGFKRSCYFFSTFWVISHGKYDKNTIKKTMILLIAGALIAAFAGFWKFSHGHSNEFNLLSINAANRSAAYVAMIIFVCMGIIFDNCSEYSLPVKIFSMLSLAFMFLALFIIGSRGAILSVAITFVLIFILIFRHQILKKALPLLMVFTTIALILTALDFAFPNSTYLQRFKHIASIRFTLNQSKMSYGDQERYDYWRVSLMYAMKNPSFFGVGPRNFREIDISNLKLKRPLTGIAARTFKAKKVLHAHNWILTLLIEQGFIGLISFIIFMVTITIRLIRKKPDNMEGRNNKQINAVWVAAFSTCFLPVISGLFNSAFSDENGWLVFFILGLGMWFINENKYYCKG